MKHRLNELARAKPRDRLKANGHKTAIYLYEMVRLSLFAAYRYVRLVPFDVQTEQGPWDERYRVSVLSILANVLSRVVGVVLTLLSVSLTLPVGQAS